MRRIVIVVMMLTVMLTAGCRHNRRTVVLRDSETFYMIPAGTPFNAIREQGDPLTEYVVNDSNMVVVYPGYLQNLQEEADARVLRPPE